MNTKWVVITIVVGGLLFVVGFVGGACLTLPNQQRVEKRIISIREVTAKEIEQVTTEAAKEIQQIVLILNRTKNELKQRNESLRSVNAEVRCTKTQIVQLQASAKTNAKQLILFRRANNRLANAALKKLRKESGYLFSKETTKILTRN